MLRSNRPEVRNPVLQLPASQKLAALPPDSRQALREVLPELSRSARRQAEKCWRTHQAPLAVDWKVVAVYSRHPAAVLGNAHP